MFLRANRRLKDGKEHRYWNIVENKRCAGGKIVQRQVLYLGEINDSQLAAWCRVIEAFDEEAQRHTQLVLFPADRVVPEHAQAHGVQVRLDAMELHRPRQWGACWLACQLYEQLELDRFWVRRLPDSREGTRWSPILQTLVCYRLIDPGSEWRLLRLWFEQSAMADLLGSDYGLVEKNALYRCLDKLLAHKTALFGHLRERWQDLFGARFEVLLYDLTSTYFESDPPDNEDDKRCYGYSRDKRSDCVQVIVALIVTPEGFPLAYEVMPGNTADCTTLPEFLRKIEAQYGKAERVWVMDRGIPTEDTLAQMRSADPPIYYLVGTPKGRLSKLEKALLGRPWQAVREGVQVKLLPQEQELYVLAQSRARIHKERAMRRRKLKWLWARLQKISAMSLTREELLMKLGAARAKARAHGGCSISTSPLTAPASAMRSIAPHCGRCGDAKVATSCAPTCADGTRPSCGSSTFSWSRSRPPSRTSRTICNYDQSTTSSNNASKRTSSSPSSPIAFTSHCAPGSGRWRPVSRRVPCSTNWPPFRCSTCTSPPPTAELWS
jgi:hypothetical protein